MAIRSSTTSVAPRQSPPPDPIITPLEDRFTEMLDAFDVADALEEDLDPRAFGDPAHAGAFEEADAAWEAAYGLLEAVLATPAEPGITGYLHSVARLMRSAMADEERASIEEILEGTVLRERLWFLFAPAADHRRTRMLVDRAMAFLARQVPRLGATLIAAPAASAASVAPMAQCALPTAA